jgi:hypothetical protein
LEIRSDFFVFLPQSGSGPVTKTKTFTFLRRVNAATAGITGYKAQFERRQDHHLGELDIRLQTTVDAHTVTVEGIFGLCDWSGNWDDSYGGRIDFVVVADVGLQ